MRSRIQGTTNQKTPSGAKSGVLALTTTMLEEEVAWVAQALGKEGFSAIIANTQDAGACARVVELSTAQGCHDGALVHVVEAIEMKFLPSSMVKGTK